MIPKRRTRPRMMAPKEDAPIRSEGFKQWVRGHQCCCVELDPTGCSGKIEAAHVRRGTDGGIGMKPGDNFCIPLCAGHHAEQHRVGEQTFEKTYKFKMLQVADRLWRRWITTTEAGRRLAEQLSRVSGPTGTGG